MRMKLNKFEKDFNMKPPAMYNELCISLKLTI